MVRTDNRSHAFVVRLWLEPSGQAGGWRGHITHVESEERRHFAELYQIVGLIEEFLEPGAARTRGVENPR